MTNGAVIGAGLSGLVVALELKGPRKVSVFEKSRGIGGRMATRYESGFGLAQRLGRLELHS